MHKTIIFSAVALIIGGTTPLTVAAAADAAVTDSGTASQQPTAPRTGSPAVTPDRDQDMLQTRDRLQDSDCDQTQDCTPILDRQKDSDQDRDRDQDKLAEPRSL